MNALLSSEAESSRASEINMPLHLSPAPLDAAGLAACSEHAVIELAQPGDPLVVTFGFAQWETVPAFDFIGRLRKLEGLLGQRFHRIHLRDPQRAWYLRGVLGLGIDVASTAAALNRAVDALKPSRVLTLGQSMGGYGAILFGNLLNADRVLAFGALSTMSPDISRGHGDTRWLSIMQALDDDHLLGPTTDLVHALTARPGNVDLRLHYGERPDAPEHGHENLDLHHARRFAKLPGCRITLHPAAAHAVSDHLRRSHELDACLLHDLFDVDKDLLHRRSRPALDDGWLQWIAENFLRGCSSDSMFTSMCDSGINPITARSAMAAIERDPSCRAAHLVLARMRDGTC